MGDPCKVYGTVLVFMSSVVIVSGLECYSCNSLSGVGDGAACEKFDKSKIGTEPCQDGNGKVARCMAFKGSVTVDPLIIDPRTLSGTYRSCAVFNEQDAPKPGCYQDVNIPSDALSTIFKALSLVGADETVTGQTCYCSGNRCNTATAVKISLANLILLLALCIMFVWVM